MGRVLRHNFKYETKFHRKIHQFQVTKHNKGHKKLNKTRGSNVLIVTKVPNGPKKDEKQSGNGRRYDWEYRWMPRDQVTSQVTHSKIIKIKARTLAVRDQMRNTENHVFIMEKAEKYHDLLVKSFVICSCIRASVSLLVHSFVINSDFKRCQLVTE